MYSKYILPALLCGAAILGITACGDDVINVDKNNVYSVTDSLDSLDCTKDNEGQVTLVKETGKMYTCSEGEWKIMNGTDAVNLRCHSDLLKDSSGYTIICDGDTIGTVYNGKNGVNGINGKNGENGINGNSCTMETINENAAVIKCGELSFTVHNGEKGDPGANGENGENGENGNSCTMSSNSDSSATIKCGDKTFTIKNGLNGLQGEQGIQGPKGDKGDKGDQGEPGINGTNGLNGKDANVDSLSEVITAAILKNVSESLEKQVKEEAGKLENRADSVQTAMKENLAQELKDSTSSISKNLETTLKTIIESKIADEQSKLLETLNTKSDDIQKNLNEQVETLTTQITKELSGSLTKTLTTLIENKIAEEQSSLEETLNTSLENQVEALKDEVTKELKESLTDSLTKSLTKSLTESLACKIDGTEPDEENSEMIVTISCGGVKSEMRLPAYFKNENLAKVYKKHVVVRIPVQTTKETKSEDIYEEIWKDLKGGDNAELTVMNLDENFAPNGKVFFQDLFASAKKSFVTVEETNEKTVEYKVVRLEGDLEVTNLNTSIVKLRVKLNLTDNKYNDLLEELENGDYSAFGGYGSKAADLIYNAYVDLSEESDTVVVDFLTDYKAARVKNLVDAGSKFAAANKQANEELAGALYLENSEEYPSFEHYVPDQIGLAENFNSIVWVMALIDQKDKTPGFNAVYNAFRNVFAENGDFNKAITTTYAGEDRSMFFVDYLALLIDANFFKWNQMQHSDNTAETNVWSGTDAVYYKILQNGFVEAYKLKVEDAKVFNDPSGYSSKVYKSDVEGGYFHYFEYIENEQVWYPITLWAVGVATVEQVCDADAVNSTFFYSFDGLDENAVCVCDNGEYYWQDTENVCLGRNKGDKGSAFIDGEIQEYECAEVECNPSASSCVGFELGPVSPSSSGSSGEYSEQNGKTPEEQANNPESKLYLGACNVDNAGEEKLFDIRNAELATTTSKITLVCDGSKWRQKDDHDEEYGICTKTVMEKGVVKEENGSAWYKCDYLDKQEKYEWIATDWRDKDLEKACHYGNVNEKVVTESGYEYVCEENSEYTDNDGNHTHEWRETTADEYCVGDRVKATVQKIEDEDLGESTFNEKCSYHGSTYVRNNTASGAKEWVYYGNFTNESTRNSVFLFLNGYKDNVIYTCNDWYCDSVSVEVVQGTIASNMPEDEKQKWINVLCNYGDYKRASGYADGIAFEVEVQLSEAEIKKTYVASAARNDWHEPTFEDIYGECDEDKMKNQTKVAVYEGIKYKCNYISGASSSGYSWVKASDLDENATLGICTRNRIKDVAIVGNAYYGCHDNDNVEGIPASSSSTDWKEISENEYLNESLNAKFDNCDTDRGDTKNIADIKSETLKDGESHSFKCSIAKEVENGNGKWVDASTDIALDQICNRDNEDATVTKESVTYVCAYKDESSMYQWITSDEYCETHGENLTYGGYHVYPTSSSSMAHCGERIECQTETDKKICHAGTESFVKLDSVWQSVAVYCDNHSTGSACEFVNHEGNINESTVKYYEQTEYYVKTEQGYKKAETAEEYCEAFNPGHDGVCVFEFDVYYYCGKSSKWILTSEYCIRG